MSEDKNDVANKLFISLGIINQLTRAFLTKKLAVHGLNPSQFDLLTHFMRHADTPQTVSQLASVMQMNQPGITKVVNKLHEMGLLDIKKDAQDGRKKWVSINPAGLDKVTQAYQGFAPFMSQTFEDWDLEEMTQTLEKLDKLKHWLDNHRDV